jgi:hypothetical protein
MRFRIAGLAPGLSLLIASFLSLTAAQCLVPIESVAHPAPGLEAETFSINQIREEVGGGEIDLSTEAARVSVPNLSDSQPSSHSQVYSEPQGEPVTLPRQLHRRILPSSSDEVG